jgi:hypothetical protein
MRSDGEPGALLTLLALLHDHGCLLEVLERPLGAYKLLGVVNVFQVLGVLIVLHNLLDEAHLLRFIDFDWQLILHWAKLLLRSHRHLIL